jgi:hypothetical protein
VSSARSALGKFSCVADSGVFILRFCQRHGLSASVAYIPLPEQVVGACLCALPANQKERTQKNVFVTPILPFDSVNPLETGINRLELVKLVPTFEQNTAL